MSSRLMLAADRHAGIKACNISADFEGNGLLVGLSNKCLHCTDIVQAEDTKKTTSYAIPG